MEFRILGPLEVAADGKLAQLGPAKQRSVLGVLLLRANEVVSREALVDAIWGEAPPPTAAKLVQVYVSQLRRALERSGGQDVIRTRAPGYSAAVEPEDLDASRFARLVADARARAESGAVDEAVELYDEALALWRGPVLADLGLEDEIGESEQLTELRLSALAERIDCELARGRHARLVGELESLAAEHPLHERFWAQLMLALYRSGRQSDALAAYRRARRVLSEEVGLEPGPELRRLERAILTHDHSLGPVGRTVPGAAARRWRPPAALAAVALAALAGGGFALFGRGGSSGPLSAIAPDSIGVVDPSRNALMSAITFRTRPAAVAYDSRSLWVAMQDDQTLLQIDPSTRRVTKTIGLGATPSAIAAADGTVWVVTESTKRLFQVDEGTGTVVRTVRLGGRIEVGEFKGAYLGPPSSVTAGAGAAWVGVGLGVVLRIDGRTGTLRQIAAGGSAGGVDYGDGAVWAASATSVFWASRIDPRTFSVTLIPPPAVGYPQNVGFLAAGASGVWVIATQSPSTNTVWRIEPALRRVTAVIPLAHIPVATALGAGAFWIANADTTVTRIDTRTNRVHTIPLGRYPQVAFPVQLAVGGGKVWVVVH